MAPTAQKETDQLEGADAQRKAAKALTFEMLRDKKPATRTVPVKLPGIDEPLEFAMQAIPRVEWDKLATKHPATTEQTATGADVNLNTFGPALLARVVTTPDMSTEQWLEIWASPNWNRGEIMSVYYAAQELCNRGLDPGPFD